MSIYRALRAVRRITPGWVLAIVRNTPGLKQLKLGLVTLAERSAEFDELYDEEFYEDHDTSAHHRRSCVVIAQTIVQLFSPRSVLDVGCGNGALLAEFAVLGIKTFGLEYALAGVKRCLAKGLQVRRFDICTDTLADDQRFDLAVSTEVAEHLPAEFADRFVDLLCAASDRVIVTAGQPGDGGRCHLNEQPPAYWIDKFASRGYRYDCGVTEQLSGQWRKAGVLRYYWRNVMCFQKGGKADGSG